MITLAKGAASNPILAGIEPAGFKVTSHLYKSRDLAKGTVAALFTRNLDPPLSPFAPPPGAIQVNPPLGAPAE